MVASVEGVAAIKEAADERDAGIEHGEAERDEWDVERHTAGGIDEAGDAEPGDHESEEVGPGISEEAARARQVKRHEAERGAGERREEHGDEGLARPGDVGLVARRAPRPLRPPSAVYQVIEW